MRQRCGHGAHLLRLLGRRAAGLLQLPGQLLQLLLQLAIGLDGQHRM
jgi:hypothetical protein